MHTNTKSIGLTSIALCLFSIFSPLFAEERDMLEITTNDIARLLPTGPDMEDQNDLARYQQLISMGEKAYPALAEMLNGTTDSIVISRILAIFVQSKGDKAIAISSAKQLLARKFNSVRDEAEIRTPVARLLGEIGSADDAAIIYPMLNDGDEFVRVNAIRALSRIGDERTVRQIEIFIGENASSATEAEIRADMSIQEGRIAIERIRERLDGADHVTITNDSIN